MSIWFTFCDTFDFHFKIPYIPVDNYLQDHLWRSQGSWFHQPSPSSRTAPSCGNHWPCYHLCIHPRTHVQIQMNLLDCYGRKIGTRRARSWSWSQQRLLYNLCFWFQIVSQIIVGITVGLFSVRLHEFLFYTNLWHKDHTFKKCNFL